MSRKFQLFVLFIAILIPILACSSDTDTGDADVAPVITEAPQQDLGYGVISCPECEGIALILWKEIGDIGGGAGEVFDGDRCKILDSGSYEGIRKYKLNCDGKIGWLRAQGVIRE